MTPGLSLLTLSKAHLIKDYMEVDDNEAQEYTNKKYKVNEVSLIEGSLDDREVLKDSS